MFVDIQGIFPHTLRIKVQVLTVFFDKLRVVWKYEKEGLKVSELRYLPDFYLSDLKCWIEVKGRYTRLFRKNESN